MKELRETPQVETLERVQLRSVWFHEATSFTPWLALHIDLLGTCIGAQLEVQGKEKSIGIFRADIIAKDTITDEVVLIENQIERTDHSHLGQLLTYAAGVQAITIVWVACEFCDEHRAALDWLNEITNDGVRFFGMEIELWRIGDSAPAPRFNVVCKPNNWKKAVISQTKREIRAQAIRIEDQIRTLHKTAPIHSLSARKIAELVGCSPQTALTWKEKIISEEKRALNA